MTCDTQRGAWRARVSRALLKRALETLEMLDNSCHLLKLSWDVLLTLETVETVETLETPNATGHCRSIDLPHLAVHLEVTWDSDVSHNVFQCCPMSENMTHWHTMSPTCAKLTKSKMVQCCTILHQLAQLEASCAQLHRNFHQCNFFGEAVDRKLWWGSSFPCEWAVFTG